MPPGPPGEPGCGAPGSCAGAAAEPGAGGREPERGSAEVPGSWREQEHGLLSRRSPPGRAGSAAFPGCAPGTRFREGGPGEPRPGKLLLSRCTGGANPGSGYPGTGRIQKRRRARLADSRASSRAATRFPSSATTPPR